MQALREQHGLYCRLQWMLGAAVGLGLVGFFLLAYRPMAGKLSLLNERIESIRGVLANNAERQASLYDINRKIERLQARIDRNGKKLPKNLDLGPFMGQLTQISQQASLRGFTWVPGPGKRLDLFQEQPICLNFEGDFLQASSFLRQIEDLQRLTRVRRLHVRSRDDKAGQVEVEVSMSIYYSEQ